MYTVPQLIRRPYLLKDIQNIERIQHYATKFILNDYDSNYKTQLLTLKLLPLMYLFEFLLLLNHLNIQLKASTFYITFHSVHPIHNLHLVKNLNILLIPIIQSVTCSFIDCLNFGIPSPLLIYIYPSWSSKLNLRITFGITLYIISMTVIHVLFI